MRHHQPLQTAGMFRNNELPRLMTMIIMLGVVLLMINRARDPDTWTWLVGRSAERKPAESDTPRQAGENSQAATKLAENHDALTPSPSPGKGEGRNQTSTTGEGRNQTSTTGEGRNQTSAAGEGRNQSSTMGEVRHEPEQPPVATGPTDQDADESDAAREEFEAVTDGTLAIQREEMPSYKRVLQWVESQPLAVLQKRARTDLTMTDLFQTPEKYRGQLIRLELNVGLISKLENLDGVPLWEVWGWTKHSKGWMYVGIVVDLPKGMPTGEVKDQGVEATLIGYFFKLQGYRPAAAKPGAPPERAPLVIGRLAWHPTAAPPPEQSEGNWMLFALAGIVLLVVVWFGLLLLGRKRRSSARLAAGPGRSAAASLENWLEHPEAGPPTAENNSVEPSASNDGGTKDSGHSKGVVGLFPDVLDGRRPHNG